MPMTQEELYQDQLNRKVLIDWVRITGLEVQRRTNYDSILQDLAERILAYPKDLPRAFSWPTMAGETKTGPAIRARMSYDFWKYFMKQGRRRLFEYNRANNTEIRLMKEQTKPVQNLEKLGLYIRKTIRDAYQKSNLTGEDIVITKGKIKIGSSEPMRPTTAAVKLNICMKKWQGDPLESMLSVQEMDAIKKGQLVYGSMKINGINIPTSEKENGRKANGEEETPHNQPKVQATDKEKSRKPMQEEDLPQSQPKRKRYLPDYMNDKNSASEE